MRARNTDMMNGHITAPYSNDLKCEVCGAAITYPESLQLQVLGYLVCQSFDCRRIMSQKSSMIPSLFKSHLQFQREIYNERREKEAAKKIYIEEAWAREGQENQTILQFILDKNSELSENNTHVLVIPTGLSRLVSLSKERVKNYTEHLKSIINQAMEYTDSSKVEFDQHHDIHEKLLEVEQRFMENPVLLTISDRICGMCKGGCCTSGREHAYLSAITIKRNLDIDPSLTATDILDLYLSNISSETIDGACINQTKTGCALPKELRSDICNSFYCDSLKSYQMNLADEEDPGMLLAIQRASTCWNTIGPDVSNEVVNIALVQEKDIRFQNISMEYIKEC